MEGAATRPDAMPGYSRGPRPKHKNLERLSLLGDAELPAGDVPLINVGDYYDDVVLGQAILEGTVAYDPLEGRPRCEEAVAEPHQARSRDRSSGVLPKIFLAHQPRACGKRGNPGQGF